jgi:hypothetical protein
VILNGNAVNPASAVEMAVDFHVIHVINALNFQRCIIALWRGYYHIQYYYDNSLIVGPYKYLTSPRITDHFDTERIKGLITLLTKISTSRCVLLILVPLYQNILNLFFTLLLMVFYTLSVNSPNERGNIDFVEGALFTFALGFFFDEVTKMLRPPTSVC